MERGPGGEVQSNTLGDSQNTGTGTQLCPAPGVTFPMRLKGQSWVPVTVFVNL